MDLIQNFNLALHAGAELDFCGQINVESTIIKGFWSLRFSVEFPMNYISASIHNINKWKAWFYILCLTSYHVLQHYRTTFVITCNSTLLAMWPCSNRKFRPEDLPLTIAGFGLDDNDPV